MHNIPLLRTILKHFRTPIIYITKPPLLFYNICMHICRGANPGGTRGTVPHYLKVRGDGPQGSPPLLKLRPHGHKSGGMGDSAPHYFRVGDGPRDSLSPKTDKYKPPIFNNAFLKLVTTASRILNSIMLIIY